MTVQSDAQQHTYEVQAFLDEIAPDTVRIELYAEGGRDHGPIKQEMARVRPLVGSFNGFIYHASVPATCPATDYTPRVVPRFQQAAVPLEARQNLWQR